MLMGKLKSREVLQLVKHFWFFTAKQYCSFFLNNCSGWDLFLNVPGNPGTQTDFKRLFGMYEM